MNKKILALIGSLFTLIIGYSLLTTIASAQSVPFNLTAYPSTFDITAKPGTTTQERFRLRNNTDTPADLSISLKKLVPNAQGNVTITDFSKTDTYQNWISLDTATVKALPQQWMDITFTVTVPKDTAFGYYYVIYITPSSAAPAATGAHASLNGSLAIPVLLTIEKPGAKAALQLVSFTPTQSFYEYLPATFSITFLNNGNTLIRPQGNVFIGSGTNDSGILSFNLANGAILPGEKRTYTASWDDGFMTQEPVMKDGTILHDNAGNVLSHLTIHWDRLTSFRIGKYTGHLLAVYNDGTRDVPLESTVTFWVFPWKIILGILLGIIIVIIIFRFWLKWYVAGQVQKQKAS